MILGYNVGLKEWASALEILHFRNKIQAEFIVWKPVKCAKIFSVIFSHHAGILAHFVLFKRWSYGPCMRLENTCNLTLQRRPSASPNLAHAHQRQAPNTGQSPVFPRHLLGILRKLVSPKEAISVAGRSFVLFC